MIKKDLVIMHEIKLKKNKKREYGRNIYHIMSKEKKQKVYQKNYRATKK